VRRRRHSGRGRLALHCGLGPGLTPPAEP